MSETSLHGNDSRQTNYDTYILLPEAMYEKNIFLNSYAVRRRATQQDADFLPVSEYPCSVTEPGKPSTPGNLSLERRAALLLGGESVPGTIIKALINNQSGKPILSSHADMVVLHNYTPLDGGFELSVIRQNLIGPVQFRCCSFGLDAESSILAQKKVARSVLLDWKDNTNKLVPPQAITFKADLPAQDAQRFQAPPLPSDFSILTINSETQLPEISTTLRKKWADDPVYGPSWLAEIRKADEILTSPAARDRVIAAGQQEAGREGGQSTEEAQVMPDDWTVKEKSGLSAFGSVHECNAEIPNVTINIAQQGESVQVFLTVARAMTVPANELLFKMASADWFKPPKSTRLLASDTEKHLHVFELHTDEAPVT